MFLNGVCLGARGCRSLLGTAVVPGVVGFLLMLVPPGVAAPYWIAWEGDDWPENQGWTRDILGGGDVRTLEDGVMTLDGLNTGPGFVWDAYEWFRPGNMDPGPGETFVMQWRLRVDAVTGASWDPTVFIHSDDGWAVTLLFAVNRVWSPGEGPQAQLPFTAGIFHHYEFRSHDMRTYELLIDGSLQRLGSFNHEVTLSWVSWGDGTGSLSRSVWDYFHYGVVAEPDGAYLLVFAVIAARVRRMR